MHVIHEKKLSFKPDTVKFVWIGLYLCIKFYGDYENTLNYLLPS